VIRFKFLERAYRFWHSLSYHTQAFARTAVLSFFLIWPSYNLVYYFAQLKAKSEVLGKMEPGMTSDALKQKIVEYKRRDREGLVERYEGSQAQEELGGVGLTDNLGVRKSDSSSSSTEEYRVSRSFNRNKRTGL